MDSKQNEVPPKFVSASAYSGDVQHLPVASVEEAANWYGKHFAMTEVDRSDSPVPRITLQRDDVTIGFAENGVDSSQNGAAILVQNIEAIHDDLAARGVRIANTRIDERDGKKFKVFFVVAPDGLCYYVHEPLDESSVEAQHEG